MLRASREIEPLQSRVLLLLAALAGSVFLFGWSHYLEFASRRALRTVGQSAGDITSVEVLSITKVSEAGPGGSYFIPYDRTRHSVTARHVLTGEQATELVRTWGRVRFVENFLTPCHDPGFVLRFLSGNRTIFEATVYFECENVCYSPAPFETDLIQMVPTSIDPKSGMNDLETFLTQLR